MAALVDTNILVYCFDDDAHLWACAECYGLPEILTEDLQHDRLYGTVRVVNPFAGLG